MGGKLPGMPALESSLTPWTVGAFGLVVVWALRGYLLSTRPLAQLAAGVCGLLRHAVHCCSPACHVCDA